MKKRAEAIQGQHIIMPSDNGIYATFGTGVTLLQPAHVGEFISNSLDAEESDHVYRESVACPVIFHGPDDPEELRPFAGVSYLDVGVAGYDMRDFLPPYDEYEMSMLNPKFTKVLPPSYTLDVCMNFEGIRLQQVEKYESRVMFKEYHQASNLRSDSSSEHTCHASRMTKKTAFPTDPDDCYPWLWYKKNFFQKCSNCGCFDKHAYLLYRFIPSTAGLESEVMEHRGEYLFFCRMCVVHKNIGGNPSRITGWSLSTCPGMVFRNSSWPCFDAFDMTLEADMGAKVYAAKHPEGPVCFPEVFGSSGEWYDRVMNIDRACWLSTENPLEELRSTCGCYFVRINKVQTKTGKTRAPLFEREDEPASKRSC